LLDVLAWPGQSTFLNVAIAERLSTSETTIRL
jgi:hypothetical protein